MGNPTVAHKRFILRHSPSTFPRASTQTVWRAGIAQEMRWNRCERFSMASWPHLRPAARNQASAKHAHHANAAMQQKYRAINKTVHDVTCRNPCGEMNESTLFIIIQSNLTVPPTWVIVGSICNLPTRTGGGKGSLHATESPAPNPATYAHPTMK